MKDVRSSRFIIIIHVLIFLCIANSCCSTTKHVEAITSGGYLQPPVVPVGVVLDTNSPFGSMLNLCLTMAVSDFYESHSNYTTTLQLHTKNVVADSVLEANFAAVELLEREQVEVMMGPQGSTQNIFMSELGERSHVPIISSTARSRALSTYTTQNNFYVRTTVDDSVQARALAALCQGFQWPQVVLLYEDTEYGHQFQSHLSNAFRDVEIRLVHFTPIPFSASDNHLFEQLVSLNEQETRVFLVHMSPPLGFRLFNIAKNVGMMAQGNAWIITDSLSNFLSSTDSATRESMEGVLGVRPYVAPSKDLVRFQERWERNSSRASMYLNVYGLWAYDTITALAIAAENIGPVTLRTLIKTNVNATRSDPSLRSSSYGPRLLREVSRTRFRGLSGHFQVSDGSLKPSSFEIMNLIGTGERIVGLWNPFKGTILRGEADQQYSIPTIQLKSIVWPGDSIDKPKGWAIPPAGILRVGVPWKPGFKQFVNVVTDPATNETRVTGFAIDIFLYSLKQLPFPINYTFLCYNESKSTNWSYDSMLKEIPQNYDMVVADTTIWAPRTAYVDFTLPYSESGIILVVRNSRPLNMWIFLKPMSLNLWLTIIATCVVVGFVIWRIEPAVVDPLQHVQEPGRGQDEQQERIQDQDVHHNRLRIFVPLEAMAFPERALVQRKTSIFILVCWLFTAFVLMQSYTANLAAILTLDQWKFSFSEDHYFGYHEGSFTREFLIEKLHISPNRLIPYQSVEGYHEGLSRGGKNGGVDGIFDEIPYMKILLQQYDSLYRIIGPRYRTDGLGFALPIGSPLVSHFSRAILNVTQGPDMLGLEQKNFGPGYSSQDPLSDAVSQGGGASLTFHNFAGLFMILAILTAIAFAYAEKDNAIRWGKQGLQYINNLRHGGRYAAVADREGQGAAGNAEIQVGEREGVNNEGQEAGHVNEE